MHILIHVVAFLADIGLDLSMYLLARILSILHIYVRPNKIEITVLRPARICFEVAALSILSKFQ